MNSGPSVREQSWRHAFVCLFVYLFDWLFLIEWMVCIREIEVSRMTSSVWLEFLEGLRCYLSRGETWGRIHFGEEIMYISLRHGIFKKWRNYPRPCRCISNRVFTKTCKVHISVTFLQCFVEVFTETRHTINAQCWKEKNSMRPTSVLVSLLLFPQHLELCLACIYRNKKKILKMII